MIRFKPQPIPTVMMLVSLAILIGLGNWQLERREWKLALIDSVTARTQQEPIPYAQALRLHAQGDDVQYLPVVVEGEFLHDREVHLFRQSVEGAGGYHVFTAFQPIEGAPILINRGYVPRERKDPAKRPDGQVGGRLTVAGLIRTDGEPGAFVPPNNPSKGEWFFRDHKAMGGALGLSETPPLFIDAGNAPIPGGFPRGGQTRVSFKNDHLGYALTWFGLAAVLLGVYVAHQVSVGRLEVSSTKRR